MTSPYRGSKTPGSQQSYQQSNPQKNILHSHGSFVFFWDDSRSQEKLKTMVMQNLGGEGEKRIIMVFSKVAIGRMGFVPEIRTIMHRRIFKQLSK